MPSISRADVDFAKRAAKSLDNLATGWGDAKDAGNVAAFLERAVAEPALYATFRDEWKPKDDLWHPAQLKAFIQSRLGDDNATKAFVDAGSPLGVRMQAMTMSADAELAPSKVGTELKNFATGWFNSEALVLLLKQLPAILKEPFAFEAMARKADGCLGVDDGAAAVAEAVRKRCASEIEQGGADAATTKLLRKLGEALA